ncbi:MAG: metabolite traffic protein EboE [Opitutaceae bacterium]|tara:strand:+ start:734 stop:1909 length:1176 start_codon:yes stop_codon:yes gene_type:complete
MILKHGLHLAYCTNVHRGESWAQTFEMLERHTLVVRQRIAAGQPYAIGLRLGQRAAAELAQPATLAAFRQWLDKHDCYVFTINGFPYGSFHGTRVKEQVYAPDWSTDERLVYTKQLFDLIAAIVPEGVSGSVSTVPGSFKAWTANDADRRANIFTNMTAIGRYVAELSDRTGRDLHLGLEPEPCCYFETTPETIEFFEGWRATDAAVESEGLLRRVGVNYDCCHLGVEFESAANSLDLLTAAGIRLSKIHLSSALRVKPDAAGRAAVAAFVEPTYLHQVVVGNATTGEVRKRYVDLPDALADSDAADPDDEWRVHFHLPLHASPGAPFSDTRDNLLDTLDWMKAHPDACQHAEMETYTWEVLPSALRIGIEDQLVREYEWTLESLKSRGLA